MNTHSALAGFFKDHAALAPNDLEDLVQVDQQQCWRSGTPRMVEEYVNRFPQLRENREVMLDMVYHEYLLRKEIDLNLGTDEFTQRFPDLATEFMQQVALHDAFDDVNQDEDPVDPSYRELRISDPDVDPQLPTFAGRYRLERLLGAGGMGEVYSAWDTELERQVAVKVPKLDANRDGQIQERILREARALAKLNHPGICPIYDFGRQGESCFIVMRRLQGITLAAELQQPRRRSVADSVRIIQKVADAVAAAHRAGIAHRDLKPSNIILESLTAPVVVDFGLVRLTSGKEVDLTESGIITGTPAYIAPERLRDSPHVDLMLADIYSLAVILYEMLAGRRPHDSTSTPTLLVQILTETIDPPGMHDSEVSPQLDAICLKALERNPDKRYASMEAFAAALAECDERPAIKDIDVHEQSESEQSETTPIGLAAARWTGIGILVAATLFSMMVYFRVPNTATIIQAGEKWSGEYQFKNDGELGPAELSIEQVSDAMVSGKYVTEGGEFAWLFEGQLSGTRLTITLTDALTAAAKSVEVSGVASIVGTVAGDQISATYKDHQSEASLRLRRQPE